MKDNEEKIFSDPIYGYINIPNYFVKNLIDTNYFQRLRNIDQTGMKVLYQNVKHDRFCHSLGVFHLGRKAIETLYLDIDKLDFVRGDQLPSFFWQNTKVMFLIACLLHDIGHTPFSHSLEEQVLNNSFVQDFKNGKNQTNLVTVGERLSNIITFYEHKYNTFYNIGQTSDLTISDTQHEQLGALYIFDKLKDNIKKIIEDVLDQEYIKAKGPISKQEKEIIFKDNLCFIARMIMGATYDGCQLDRQIRNCFIELLNGKNFDVDNLDYILRDTYMSGINNVTFDVDQLLSSICFVVKTKHYNKKNLGNKTLSLLNNMTITKFKNKNKKEITLKGNLKGTIILKKNTKVTLGTKTAIEYFSGVNGERAKIAYTSEKQATFKKGGNIIESGEIKKSKNGEITLWGKGPRTPFECSITDGIVIEEFNFKTSSDVCLKIHGDADIKIDGCFDSETPLSLYSISDLQGAIDEIEILGDSFKAGFMLTKEPNTDSYYTLSLGFKKKAMNIIANVLDARNYLYLWIYAQYKVVYYANFLIPVLADTIFHPIEIENPLDFPNCKLDYQHLDYLDDFYVWTAMKHLYVCQKDAKIINKNYLHLFNELFNHTYKDSLYKSLAEYEIFFGKFNSFYKNEIFNFFKKNIDPSQPNLTVNKEKKAGYLKSHIIKDLNEIISKLSQNSTNPKVKIKNLIFVPAAYKRKKLDTQKVFLKLDFDKIIPISEIPLLKSQCHSNDDLQTGKYFYLYYELKVDVNKSDLEIIQTAITNYLENKIK